MNKLYNSFAFLSKNSYYLCFGTKSVPKFVIT
mgnify:CR=1 FL=1